jgi:Bacterial phospho-glucose isomerase C-terminal SIS domain
MAGLLNLDSAEAIRTLDKANIGAALAGVPALIQEAATLGESADLPASYARVGKIVLCGIGESARACALAATIAGETCNVPIFVHQGADLPAFADGQGALIVLVDHDGQTAVTQAARDLADARGTKMVVIAGGGALAKAGENAGSPVWVFSAPPRLAFFSQVVLLLALLGRLGLISNPDFAEVAQSATALIAQNNPDKPPIHNAAKRLAGQFLERLPLIYGGGPMAHVAAYWRDLLALMANLMAVADALPGLERAGLSGALALNAGQRLATVHLAAPGHDHALVVHAAEFVREVLMMEGTVPDTLAGQGQSALAQALYAALFGAYTAYYTAVARDLNPGVWPILQELSNR